ncbi:helix-turn-helix domain-containing protein [Jeotgalibaca porci]|uniref:helix-turn-helix domain-containing protein n=1 Tax=Jeotgalibaca porci TaxID=1868793 RepID=UPI00359F9023
MLNLEDIVRKLHDRNIKVVSKKTGISYHTILNIQKGENKNPTMNTLVKLSDYLEGN